MGRLHMIQAPLAEAQVQCLIPQLDTQDQLLFIGQGCAQNLALLGQVPAQLYRLEDEAEQLGYLALVQQAKVQSISTNDWVKLAEKAQSVVSWF